MLYARSDVTGFSGATGCPSGGHSAPADPDDNHFSVDCPPCEAFLVSDGDPLWATSPEEVPLTRAEEKALQAEQHQAELGSAQMGLALQQLLREQLVKTGAASAPTPALEEAPKPRTPSRKAAAAKTAVKA